MGYLVIDSNEIFYQSIFVVRRMKKTENLDLPFEFFFLRKIFSVKKKFKERSLVLGVDGRSPWRRQIYPDYKATRKQFRESYQQDIDWDDAFKRFNLLISRIDILTPILVYKDEILEFDDLVAIMAKKGLDIIVYSSDKDLTQLYVYPNYKQLSPRVAKLKFKEVKDPLKVLNKLIMSGDTSDNIPKAVTESQRLINTKLVDLIHLPEFIEKRVESLLTQSQEKGINLEEFYTYYPYKFLIDSLKEL